MPSRRSEGSGCKCGSPEEHALLVRRVDASFEKDAERVTLGLKVATAEALVKRAAVGLFPGAWPADAAWK